MLCCDIAWQFYFNTTMSLLVFRRAAVVMGLVWCIGDRISSMGKTVKE